MIEYLGLLLRLVYWRCFSVLTICNLEDGTRLKLVNIVERDKANLAAV